jgi:RNA polymerase subunit RPABC4/transcription elongation factor Spt4
MIDKTRECPSCALEINEEADECPYCGYDLPRQKRGFGIAVAVFVLLLLTWLIW